MTEFRIDITIHRSPDIVDRALQNPDNHTCWTRYLEKFEVISGTPGKAGSVAHLHYRQKGHSYVLEDRLLYCDPGKKYVSRVSGDFIIAEVEINLDPSGNNTKMSIRWTGKGKSLLLKLMLPLQRRKMIRQSLEELETFKKLVEERGENFGAPAVKEKP